MKLAVAGCMGRMGRTLIEAALSDARFTLAAASEKPGFDEQAAYGMLAAAGCLDLPILSDAAELAEKADAVIDFTSPDATAALAEAIAKKGGVHIIGTTGLSGAHMEKIKTAAKSARIVQSGNFSLGVNILTQLVRQTAKSLDERYDIEISEMHHRHKKDAPSGTALMLGQAAAAGRGVTLEQKKVVARDGITGERRVGDIGFSVLRGGDTVGEHRVYFAGPGEVIELRHQGFSRLIYAGGALQAALWAKTQPPGLYGMQDVIKL